MLSILDLKKKRTEIDYTTLKIIQSSYKIQAYIFLYTHIYAVISSQ